MTVKKKSVLIKLINLINGHFRTPKIEALFRLIDWFNKDNNNNINIIPKLDIDTSSILENSWLSGFIDADGNFYINWKISKKSKLINIIYYMRIYQKEYYTRKVNPDIKESNFVIMTKIAKDIESSLIYVERNRIKYIEKGYIIRTDKIVPKEILFNYLREYPLFGYKRYLWLILEEIHILLRKSNYKNEKELEKLLLFYSNQNKGLTKNDWDHLNDFYRI